MRAVWYVLGTKTILSLGLSFLVRMGNWGLSLWDSTLGSSRVPLGFLVGRTVVL